MKRLSEGKSNNKSFLKNFLERNSKYDFGFSAKPKMTESRIKLLIEAEAKRKEAKKPKKKSFRERFKMKDVLHLDEFNSGSASKSKSKSSSASKSKSKSKSSSAPMSKSKSSSAPGYESKSKSSPVSSSRSKNSLDILKDRYELELERKKSQKWDGFQEYHFDHLKTVCGASLAKYPLKMLIPESKIPKKTPRRIGTISHTTLGGWVGKPGEIEGKPLQKEFITKILEKQLKKTKELKNKRIVRKDLHKAKLPKGVVTRKVLLSQNYKDYEKMIEKMRKSEIAISATAAARDKRHREIATATRALLDRNRNKQRISPHIDRKWAKYKENIEMRKKSEIATRPRINLKWMNEPGTYDFLRTNFKDTRDLTFLLRIKHFYLHFRPQVKTSISDIDVSFKKFFTDLDNSAKDIESGRKDKSKLGTIISNDVINNLKLLRCLFAIQHYRKYSIFYKTEYNRSDKLIEELLKMKHTDQCRALNKDPIKYFKAFEKLSTAPKIITEEVKTKKNIYKQKTSKEIKKDKSLQAKKDVQLRKKLLKEKMEKELVRSKKMEKDDLRDAKNIEILESGYDKSVKELHSTAKKLGVKGYTGLNKSALTNLINKTVRTRWKGQKPIKELEELLKSIEKTKLSKGVDRELKLELDKIKYKIKNHPDNIINYCDTRAVRAEKVAKYKYNLENEEKMLNQEKMKKQVLDLEHLNKMITKFPNPWIWKEQRKTAKIFFEEFSRVEIRKVYTKLSELEILKKIDSQWKIAQKYPKKIKIFYSLEKEHNKKADMWDALITKNYNILQMNSTELTDYEFASVKQKLTEELFHYRNTLDSFKTSFVSKDPPKYVTSIYYYADERPTIPTVIGPPLRKIPRKSSKTPPETPPSKSFIFNTTKGSYKSVKPESNKKILKGSSIKMQFNPEAYKYYTSPPEYYKVGMSYKNTFIKRVGKGYTEVKGNYLDPKIIAAITIRDKPQDIKKAIITHQDVETAFKETYYKEKFPSLSSEIRDFAFDNAISLQESKGKITLKSLKKIISKEKETETVQAMTIAELQEEINIFIESMSKKCQKGKITKNKAKKEIEKKAIELQELRKEPSLKKKELKLFTNQLDCLSSKTMKPSAKPSKKIINFDDI